MKSVFKVFAVLFFVLVSNCCLAALQTTNVDVDKIDFTTNTAIFWVSGNEIIGRPEACNAHPTASCLIAEEYCKNIVSLALAAKLAKIKVEFTYTGTCNGSFPNIGRFRLM